LNSGCFASQASHAVQPQEFFVSTKDISRSALEGGRANYNKYERNESHRHERSRTKAWLDGVRFDHEAADASAPVPRNPVGKGFTDKLSPCYRWLASRCGQPWAKIYSELSTKFDTRNLASWHIVNQHMLSDVLGAGTARDTTVGLYASHRFFIDVDGILRDRGKRWRRPVPAYTGPSKESVLAYAKGRKVLDGMYMSSMKYWALPGAGQWQACKGKHCEISKSLHRVVETTSQVMIERYASPGLRSLGDGDWWRTYVTQHWVTQTWRSHKNLTKAELIWWDSISYEIRRLLYVPRMA
jgi:hypothetical protein